MPRNTYVALATIQPVGLTTSVVMDSIPSTYTDLVLVSNFPKDGAGSARIFLNNDSSSGLYSQTVGYAKAAGSGGGRETSANTYYLMDYVSASTTAPNMSILNIMNYASTDRFKTIIETAGASDAGNVISVGSWRNTSAITKIEMSAGGALFTTGASFTLYGIKNWSDEATPKATGGYVYSDSTYWYHAFPYSSTFVPNQTLSCDVLAVAGGGAGFIGGGGAGGLLTFTAQSFNTSTHTITVGAGGVALVNDNNAASKGSNTTVGALTAAVGGGSGTTNDNGGSSFRDGGSGGGAGGSSSQTTTGGAGTSGQGNNGGNNGGFTSSPFPGGGGGGGGAIGGSATNANTGGNGGIGATSAFINAIGAATGYGQISSGNYYFAGGGGGGGNGVTNFGIGGAGGGATSSNVPVAAAKVSTGGGGGGNNGGLNRGSNGGSGIVVIRYAK